MLPNAELPKAELPKAGLAASRRAEEAAGALAVPGGRIERGGG